VQRLVERIFVQMAYHSMSYATSTVLKYLLDSKAELEQVLGLRVVEILIDESSGRSMCRTGLGCCVGEWEVIVCVRFHRTSGFQKFALTAAANEGNAVRARMQNTIMSVSSDFLQVVLSIMKSAGMGARCCA